MRAGSSGPPTGKSEVASQGGDFDGDDDDEDEEAEEEALDQDVEAAASPASAPPLRTDPRPSATKPEDATYSASPTTPTSLSSPASSPSANSPIQGAAPQKATKKQRSIFDAVRRSFSKSTQKES
eukprot:TRINITY_DN63619_c0_g1_i2.p1 TRINITY_DN63619_c0_g1~~TRINITY_DN63619_c0_g1_i2.p1  ORF type:complete len:125 (+),score=35.64 TRINITY_DN63619_c0_g1_i2:166-540(+)